MTLYAKLVDGVPEFAPINKDNIINYNLNVPAMTADGYKEFIECERPETIRKYHIEYKETKKALTETIAYEETQEEAEQRIAQEEEGRINTLKMTALDFIGVLQYLGLTLEQITAYLDSNLQLKTQLTYCQNVYCGVVRKLCPITVGEVELTEEKVVLAFKYKNGEVGIEELTSSR